MKYSLYKYQFPCLNTLITIKFFLQIKNNSKADIIFSKIKQEFDRIQKTYTRFDHKSELSKLNTRVAVIDRKKGVDPSTRMKVKIKKEMFFLIKQALEFANFSKGRFDPTILPILEELGYDKSFKKDNRFQSQINKRVKHTLKLKVGWKDINLLKKKKQYFIEYKNARQIDLGSIGKGYAIDQTASIFDKYQVKNFLIEAGGDVFGKGKNLKKNKNWTVDLYLNINSSLFSRQKSKFFGLKSRRLIQYNIKKTGESICSSGGAFRSSGDFHHLIEKKTQKPYKYNLQSFVIADKAILADGLATVLFLTDKSYVEEIEKTYNAQCVLINNQKKVILSDNFKL